MILYSIRARLTGSGPEAIAWAHQVAELSKKITGINVEVASRIGGGQDFIWVSRYDNLAAFEKATDAVLGNADYQVLLKTVREKALFDIGSVETALWRTV